MASITQTHIPVSRAYKSNKGLSERQVKARLEKEGWEVWRGGCINIIRREEIYPNVKNKYEKLKGLLSEHHEELSYMCAVHHGMPDFVCHRQGKVKFVECKFGNEQLSARQRTCIDKLIAMGYEVEIASLALASNKARRSELDLSTNKRRVLERQKSFRQPRKSRPHPQSGKDTRSLNH